MRTHTQSVTRNGTLLLWIGWLLAGLAIAGAVESRGSRDEQRKTVIIYQFEFQPNTLDIHAGDTVEWKNIDIVPHTATVIHQKLFDSGPIEKGSSWRFTFGRKGIYDYECTLHPNMRGRVVVK